MNGAVLIVFTIKTVPFFCVCPVYDAQDASCAVKKLFFFLFRQLLLNCSDTVTKLSYQILHVVYFIKLLFVILSLRLYSPLAYFYFGMYQFLKGDQRVVSFFSHSLKFSKISGKSFKRFSNIATLENSFVLYIQHTQ
jgi:hypothetical protein